MSSVVQAAWALLLSHYSDATDVVFGAAFSGRPPELPGIDELIGPCVNNVPVRARISRAEPVASLATQLQQKQPDLSLHQYDSLAQIQGWAGIPLRLRLFDSLVVFQNYIVDESALTATERRTTSSAGRSRRHELPDHARRSSRARTCASSSCGDRSQFSQSQGRTMLRDLRTVLEAIGDASRTPAPRACSRGFPPTRAAGRPRWRRSASLASTAAYVAPVGQMEETVAAIWRELFQVDRIGMDDNFFDLGGHSLLLVRAHERLLGEVRADLPIAALFQYPTARSLARYLSGAERQRIATRGTKERAERQKEALARMRAARGKR